MSATTTPQYDAFLLVSFGGPDGPDEVVPFLENVLRGRNVPRERLLEVAEHYYHFGGKSPINDQNRALLDAVRAHMAEQGRPLPIYWGNRNWHPMLADTLRQMAQDGVQHALAFVTSGFSCYSGCRQYREDIARAQAEVGPEAPRIDKIRVFYNHPGFVEPMTQHVRDAFAQIPEDRRAAAPLLFTAHSIPSSMANTSRYVEQLREACRLVAEGAGRSEWELVYQSRSGAPNQPWLEPDVVDRIRQLHAERQIQDVVVSPIGFVSDHMEVLYDLDTEAQAACAELGIHMVRVATVGTAPAFVAMIDELVQERQGQAPKRALGLFGPNHDVCPDNCCPMPARPAPAAAVK